MGRRQSPILDPKDGSTNNYWFVVQWIARRFDEEELMPLKFVMSEPVGIALDQNEDIDQAHARVRTSWRELQKRWTFGWEKNFDGKLPNAEAYFDALVAETNAWIDKTFPVNAGGAGQERKRLLAAVRQQRLRERRQAAGSRGAIQVSISGDLHKQLWRRYEIPESKQHDLVRAALQIVLDSPELLGQAKRLIGVTS